jgi:hypothetical protein
MPSENNGPSTSSQSSKGKRKAIDLKEDVQDSVKSFEDREMALLVSYNINSPSAQFTDTSLRLSLIDSKTRKNNFFWYVLYELELRFYLFWLGRA